MSMAHPGGRPTKYRPEYCQMLVDHGRQGLSFESFAGVLGIYKDTLYNWFKEYPEFSDAKKQCVEYSRQFWDKKAVEALSNDNNLNPTVLIFNLKNRFRDQWSDRIEQTIEAKIENVDATKKIEDKLNGLLAEIQSRKSK